MKTITPKLRNTTYTLKFKEEGLTKKELEDKITDSLFNFDIKRCKVSYTFEGDTWYVSLIVSHYKTIRDLRPVLKKLFNEVKVSSYHNKKLKILDVINKML